MEFTQGLLTITIVHLLAAASPGPDFVMVTQQTLSRGRRAGLLVSVGIALGLSVHILYSSLGLAAVIASSTSLLWLVKILGGSYLLYLGVKGLCSKKQEISAAGVEQLNADGGLRLIGMGFLCNALNPKAPIYFVSLFTIVLSPNLPLYQLAVYGLWIILLQLAWFSLVATLLAVPPISKRINSWGHYIDRLFGGAMLLLGVKVITSKSA